MPDIPIDTAEKPDAERALKRSGPYRWGAWQPGELLGGQDGTPVMAVAEVHPCQITPEQAEDMLLEFDGAGCWIALRPATEDETARHRARSAARRHRRAQNLLDQHTHWLAEQRTKQEQQQQETQAFHQWRERHSIGSVHLHALHCPPQTRTLKADGDGDPYLKRAVWWQGEAYRRCWTPAGRPVAEARSIWDWHLWADQAALDELGLSAP